MIVGVLKEVLDGENRVAITPQTVKDLLKSGLEVHIQAGAGKSSFIADSDYENSGARIIADASSILLNSDLIIKVATATLNEIDQLKNGIREGVLKHGLVPYFDLDCLRSLTPAVSRVPLTM